MLDIPIFAPIPRKLQLLAGPPPNPPVFLSKLTDLFGRGTSTESAEPKEVEAPSVEFFPRHPVSGEPARREVERRPDDEVSGSGTGVEGALRALRRLRDREGWTAGMSGDPDDLRERIVRAAKLTSSRGVSRLRLLLTPPELGEVCLDLSIRGKTLTATLRARRPSTAEAILAGWPELKAALERQGFEIGGISVGGGGEAEDGAEESDPLQVMDLSV